MKIHIGTTELEDIIKMSKDIGESHWIRAFSTYKSFYRQIQRIPNYDPRTIHARALMQARDYLTEDKKEMED
jgi:hypothetical protein